MSSITVSSLVLGSLTVEVDGADASLALSVLGTAPASLTIELGTPGAQGNAATIAVGTTTTLNPGESATVVNVGTSSAATFNFGIPKGEQGVQGIQGSPGNAATVSVGSTTTGAAGSSASVTNSGTSSAAVLQFTIPRGDTGATGATGATGPAGPGVATGGTTGQFLSKASGTNYDTTWATIVPGDRYLTSSTTSLTIGNGTKSLTVGTGLSYTTTQNVTITFDASNHMHGEVLTYNAGTGAMTVNVNHHTGSGTYAVWTVNVGGVTPVTSTTWGTITGTLSSQVDLQGSLDAKLAKASNLSDLTNAGTARTNLGLGTMATETATNYLAKADNLSGLASTSTARTNLGLGTAAVEPATKLVPAGGTTGQALVKLSNADWDDGWATIGGGSGGGIDIQTFGTSGTSGTFTWTKPANAKWVEFILIGGGGGGGSGARQVTGTPRGGGGGGSGGAFYLGKCKASRLGATETVVVGAGGAGAAAVTVNSTNGSNGTNGQDTRFAYGAAAGGNGGGNGSSIGGSGGSARSGLLFNATIVSLPGGAGATSTATAAQSTSAYMLIGTGGGGGAGATTGVTTNVNGAAGGQFFSTSTASSGLRSLTILGGTGGTAAGVQATAGTSQDDYLAGGTGGGGGFYMTGVAGGTGGTGGFPCGGGGGGGASDNGFNSGAGGKGGNGFAVIITYT